MFLLDQARYLNHFYLISLVSFLLVFVPAERALSVDALLRPRMRSDVTPAWTLWLLRAQIGIPYFYGGIAKLNNDWLRGEPMRMWLAGKRDFPLIGPFFTEDWMVYQFVVGGLLLDLLVVPLLLWTRNAALRVRSGRRVSPRQRAALLDRIMIFPWFMICATLIFFPPDLFRRIARALRQSATASSRVPQVDNPVARGDDVPVADALSGQQTACLAFLALYLTVQVLVPLRHFAYPGNVSWTEEGHRFSWHMMLRSKRADTRFSVSDPAGGQGWFVDPRRYLLRHQLEEMVTRPDMILQFSRYLADETRRQGYPDVQVRARVMASLTGASRSCSSTRRPIWQASGEACSLRTGSCR